MLAGAEEGAGQQTGAIHQADELGAVAEAEQEQVQKDTVDPVGAEALQPGGQQHQPDVAAQAAKGTQVADRQR